MRISSVFEFASRCTPRVPRPAIAGIDPAVVTEERLPPPGEHAQQRLLIFERAQCVLADMSARIGPCGIDDRLQPLMCLFHFGCRVMALVYRVSDCLAAAPVYETGQAVPAADHLPLEDPH